ncbi:MAG: antibiotic biosynthesis monooxygenase [Candidatus Accumulibacter propinquus]
MRRRCARCFEISSGPSRNETGCVSYDLFENEDNPLEFVSVEQWRGSGGS